MPHTAMPPYRFRYARQEDLKKLASLDAMQDENLHRFTEKEFYDQLTANENRATCLVAEAIDEGCVDAYVIYQWDVEGNADLPYNHLYVLRIVVHPDERYGLAERGLIIEMLKRASRMNGQATYYCREHDLGQQLILSTSGFRGSAVHRGYFGDSGEDAYEFKYEATTRIEECERASKV